VNALRLGVERREITEDLHGQGIRKERFMNPERVVEDGGADQS
jgi:hypothetical protein